MMMDFCVVAKGMLRLCVCGLVVVVIDVCVGVGVVVRCVAPAELAGIQKRSAPLPTHLSVLTALLTSTVEGIQNLSTPLTTHLPVVTGVFAPGAFSLHVSLSLANLLR